MKLIRNKEFIALLMLKDTFLSNSEKKIRQDYERIIQEAVKIIAGLKKGYLSQRLLSN